MADEHRKNLGQIVDSALTLIGDFRGAGLDGHWNTRAESRAIARRVYLSLVRDTGILRDTATIPIIANTHVYDLPNDLLRPIRIGMDGPEGYTLIANSAWAIETSGLKLVDKGSPYYFYRDIFSPSQIAVYPEPQTTGSTMTRDSDYGLLRAIRDADGNYLPYDANLPLRDIRGVPFMRSGTGQIIREVISPLGNLYITYVRSPGEFINDNDFPDSDIPTTIHKDFRFGVAEILLEPKHDNLSKLKHEAFKGVWRRAKDRLKKDFAPTATQEGLVPV